MVSQITRFAFGGKCGFVITPRHLSGASAAKSEGFSSDDSASEPIPALPRNARREREEGRPEKLMRQTA
jgi:hypothetical protein